ncbi:MAG TPA: glycosyltransferase family 4 protein [Mycobacteriales bacterium]|nr:glycosyltransferase family 4 protein [Mycobacteriales bacterium]
MRIILTHLYCWPEVRRGAERYAHELAASLRRTGHDARLISSAPRPQRDLVLDVPVSRLRRRGYLRRYGEAGLGAEFAARCTPRVVAARPDVWHALSPADAAAATLLRKVRPGMRAVYTEVGFPSKRSHDRRPDRRLYNRVVRDIDQFLCLSQPASDLLLTDYGRPGVTMPAGVDIRRFDAGGPRHPTPVLLFPSVLSEPRKNVGLVLEAAALLRAANVEIEVWLAGPGQLPNDLSELARKGLDAVTMHRTADADELAALYGKAWVTVLPSHSEVFGLVVLESMACGTPVVVLDDGLGPSLLVTEGTGVRCAPDGESVAAACRAAIDLAADPPTAQRCKEHAADYDWDTVVTPMIVSSYER